MVKVKKDLTGQRFGRLTVVYQTDDYVKPNGKHEARWHCVCDCDEHNEIDVVGYNLKSGNTTQCLQCANASKIKKLKKQNNYIQKKDYCIGYTSNTNVEFIFDNNYFDKVKNYCWYEDNNGYIVTHLNNGKHLKLHRFIMSCFDKHLDIDHINHNKADNRKVNLRICTRQHNLFNKGLTQNNSSGIIGVYYDKKLRKWIAQITVNYKHIHLGVFELQSDAIKARVNAEIKYFGKYRYNNKETI